MVLGMGLAVACCRGSSLQSPNKPGTTALRVRLFLAKLQAMSFVMEIKAALAVL